MRPANDRITTDRIAEHNYVREINVWNALGGWDEYKEYDLDDMEAVDLLPDGMVTTIRQNPSAYS